MSTPARGARLGHEPSTGLYYERLGDTDDNRPPLLFIHGAGATGAGWRVTPDGRPGWADLLAEKGREIWLADWPGTGRSGNRDGLHIRFADVVDGFQALLRDVIDRPVTIVCHSMGGAVTWQLVEHQPDLVTGVLSVAAAYPGNLVPRSEMISDDGVVATVRFADTEVVLTVDRRVMNLYEDAYIYKQAVAGSTHFAPELVDRLRASLVGVPPMMLLERLGVIEGMPRVADASGFVGLPVLLVAGDQDPAHTHEIESRTVGQLSEWGAEAELLWLPDAGIEGNGHYLFLEDNSERILELVSPRLAGLTRSGPTS